MESEEGVRRSSRARRVNPRFASDGVDISYQKIVGKWAHTNSDDDPATKG